MKTINTTRTEQRIQRFKERISFVYIYSDAMYFMCHHGVNFENIWKEYESDRNIHNLRELGFKRVYDLMNRGPSSLHEENSPPAFDNSYALAFAFHAYFESRFSSDAVNDKGKAIGLFQFTPFGMGSRRTMYGKKVAMMPIGSLTPDLYKKMMISNGGEIYDEEKDITLIDGMNDEYQADAIKLSAHKYINTSRESNFGNLGSSVGRGSISPTIMQSYKDIYWTPLCGGFINKKEADELCETNPHLIRRNTERDNYVFPFLLDRGIH